MKKLDVNNFDEFINSDEKVMVKFGASWCSPCVAMEPVLESVSEKYPDRVADVDIMSNKELTERFGIRNIPATIFFKNGEEVNRKSGIIEFKTIESLLVD